MCLGIPGRIEERYERDGLPMARVLFGAVCKECCLVYEPQAEVGQHVLVHVGFAISVIDEEEARSLRQTLDELAGSDEQP